MYNNGILSCAYEVTHGKPYSHKEDKEKFEGELKDFRSLYEDLGNNTITVVALKKWFTGAPDHLIDPSRQESVRFLLSYLSWSEETGKISDSFKNKFEKLHEDLSAIIKQKNDQEKEREQVNVQKKRKAKTIRQMYEEFGLSRESASMLKRKKTIVIKYVLAAEALMGMPLGSDIKKQLDEVVKNGKGRSLTLALRSLES